MNQPKRPIRGHGSNTEQHMYMEYEYVNIENLCLFLCYFGYFACMFSGNIIYEKVYNGAFMANRQHISHQLSCVHPSFLHLLIIFLMNVKHDMNREHI